MAVQETPPTKNELKDMVKFLRRMLCYNRDLYPVERVQEIQDEISQAQTALKTSDTRKIQETGRHLRTHLKKNFPPPEYGGWRENVEVLFVALVLAFAIRTYFLQPFQIPTGSMQPTLYGIDKIAEDIPERDFPSVPRQIFEKIFMGRSYVFLKPRESGPIAAYRGFGKLYWLEFSQIQIGRDTYTFWIPLDYLNRIVPLYESGHPDKPLTGGRIFAAGEVAASTCMTTGDFVFVDKFSYNFIRPKRGEVFVFMTTGISDITANLRSQNIPGDHYYIKRLSALGGDTVQIVPPHLLVDGKVADFNKMYKRIYSMQNGYNGYVLRPDFKVLHSSEEVYTVPEDHYFALGDNSRNSWDSRGWGSVPAQHVVGRGFMVFYPFTTRWGFIH
ncbi:MAG: signal peptidase I [Verrucomicrobiae bacterium]|nr:signal peptidase I [Verrucomicrobiae bacterium]